MIWQGRLARQDVFRGGLKADKKRRAGHKMEGLSCGIFDKYNATRTNLHALVHSMAFEWFITVLIILSCASLAYEQPKGFTTQAAKDNLILTDIIFTAIFVMEMFMRMIADGVYQGEYSYMQDPWNILDFVVVVGSVLGLGFPNVTIIRVLRAFRPLRIAVRFEEVRVVIYAIMAALPALINTAIFCFLFWLVLSILGVHLFAEKYPDFVIRTDTAAGCNDGLNGARCVAPSLFTNMTSLKKACDSANGVWKGGVTCFNRCKDEEGESKRKKCEEKCGVCVGCGSWTKEEDTDKRRGCEAQCGICVGKCFKYRKGELFPKNMEKKARNIKTKWEQEYICATTQCSEPQMKGKYSFMHKECASNNFNFNNVMLSTITLYKLGQMTSWYQEMYTGIRATGSFAIVFFILVVLICGFFTLNLIIAVVVDNFNRMGAGKEYNALLTKPQAIHIRSARLMEMYPLIVNEDFRPREGDMFSGLRSILYSFINFRYPPPPDLANLPSPWFDTFIMLCIAANAFFMCTSSKCAEGDIVFGGAECKEWNGTLDTLDNIFTIIYTVEAALKIFANWTTNGGLLPDGCTEETSDGFKCKYVWYEFWNIPPFKWWTDGWQLYWRDPWNKFDFIVVAASLIGMGFSSGAPTATVRLLRLGRLVKVIANTPKMRACFATLMYALPSMVNIGVLLFIVFYIWSVFGISVFGFAKDDWNDGLHNTPINTDKRFRDITSQCYNSIEGPKARASASLPTFNFNSFGSALLSNWRIATNDEWEAIYCWTYKKSAEGAVFYFTTFGLFGNYLMANLFIAVMLMTWRDNIKMENQKVPLDAAGVDEWVDEWKKIDPNGTGFSSGEDFQKTLTESPVLVGLMLGKLGQRRDQTVTVAQELGDFYNDVDPRQDAKRTVTNAHLGKIFTSQKFHVVMQKYGLGTPRECSRVYYKNAIYAIAGVVTGYMNLEPPYAQKGRDKLPKHLRTEERIHSWHQKGDINNMGQGDDQLVAKE